MRAADVAGVPLGLGPAPRRVISYCVRERLAEGRRDAPDVQHKRGERAERQRPHQRGLRPGHAAGSSSSSGGVRCQREELQHLHGLLWWVCRVDLCRAAATRGDGVPHTRLLGVHTLLVSVPAVQRALEAAPSRGFKHAEGGGRSAPSHAGTPRPR
eukprot:COSAG03_NODE_2883_length_2381_cov_1.811569_2_plen_156_part_00